MGDSEMKLLRRRENSRLLEVVNIEHPTATAHSSDGVWAKGFTDGNQE